jgi:hypothetical protein
MTGLGEIGNIDLIVMSDLTVMIDLIIRIRSSCGFGGFYGEKKKKVGSGWFRERREPAKEPHWPPELPGK